MIRRFIVFVAFMLAGSVSKASFEFNDNCKNAYREVVNLKLDLAKQYIEKEKRANSNNSMIYLIENYIDYFYILASDNKADFDKLKKNKSVRLSKISADDKESPYYLFAQAEINLQWSLLRGRYQEYVTSALEIKRAYNMLQENAEKYPTFLPNYKGLGMLNAVIGSLPSGAQKALGTLGVRGSTTKGQKMLEDLVDELPNSPYDFFYDESVFYLSQVWVNITKKRNAFEEIIAHTERLKESSLLKVYIRAYSAYKTGHNDAAITYLLNTPKESGYVDYPYLDYLLGMAKLNKLDITASLNFNDFLQSTKGASLIKDTYLHLAYIAILKGDRAQYRSLITKVKGEGASYDEKDKQAINEANEGEPNKTLLKARFLFDGGYYDKAKAILTNENANDYKEKRYKIEYCYRFGRVFHETGGMAGAIKFYNYTIYFGEQSKYYYAANAAVFLGDIYAEKKQYNRAAESYNKAINMKNHDYESSIENKAKEGLKRIEGRF